MKNVSFFHKKPNELLGQPHKTIVTIQLQNFSLSLAEILYHYVPFY